MTTRYAYALASLVALLLVILVLWLHAATGQWIAW